MSSLDKKLNAYLESKTGQKRLKDAAKEKYGFDFNNPEQIVLDIAEDFKDILRTQIETSGIPSRVAIELVEDTDFVQTPVQKNKNGKYSISISFAESTKHRPSLVPYLQGANLPVLYNNGAKNLPKVYGTWIDHYGHDNGVIGSATRIDGGHYMESAVDIFKTKYSGMLNITVQIGDDWECAQYTQISMF